MCFSLSFFLFRLGRAETEAQIKNRPLSLFFGSIQFDGGLFPKTTATVDPVLVFNFPRLAFDQFFFTIATEVLPQDF